jgi:hypothetical protein
MLQSLYPEGMSPHLKWEPARVPETIWTLRKYDISCPVRYGNQFISRPFLISISCSTYYLSRNSNALRKNAVVLNYVFDVL